MKPEQIDAIVIHCSATPAGLDYRAADIDRWHKKKRWKMLGYNYVIDLDGKVEVGRPLTIDGAHCNTKGVSGRPYNSHSIGICYVGGLEATKDKNGNIIAKKDSRGRKIPKDTRTFAQKLAMEKLVYDLMEKYPIVEVIGHRDASPDKDGDGVINRYEWIKDCPCFDVRSEFPISVCVSKKGK